MATIATLRTQLQTRLNTIAGLNGYDRFPDSLKTPAAIVRPMGMGEKSTLGGDNYDEFEIILLVPEPKLATAQTDLDRFCANSGTQSIQAAIEGGETLGGNADFALWVGWLADSYQEYEIDGARYFGAKARVKVWH